LPAAPSTSAATAWNHAAIGVSAIVSVLSFTWSRFTTFRDTLRAADRRKFPAAFASQQEMWLMVSVVVMFQFVGAADSDLLPADAADQVTCWRVVTADWLDVPAAPGSPMWSCTQNAAGALNADAPSMSSHLLASV